MKKKEIVKVPEIPFEEIEKTIYQGMSALQLCRKQYEKETRDAIQEAIDELFLTAKHLGRAREVIENITAPAPF